MPNILRQPTPLVVVTSVLLAIISIVRGVVAPSAIDAVGTGYMPLSEWMERLSELSPVLYIILTTLMVVCCMVNVLSASLYSIESGRRTTLPLQVWVLLGCGVVFPFRALTAYVTAFVLSIALKCVARSFKRSYSFGAVFSASFAFGLLPLFGASFAWLYLILPVMWTLARRTFREVVVGCVGVLLPLFSAAYIYWCRGEAFGLLFEMLYDGACSPLKIALSGIQIGVVGVWVLTALMLSITMMANASSLRTKPRTMGYIHTLLLIVLLVSLVCGGGSIVVPSMAVLVALLSPNALGRGLLTKILSMAYIVFAIVILAYNIFALSL